MYDEAGMGKGMPPDKVKREIDENIKRIYQQVLEEELPDRFKALLAKLRQQPGPDA